MPGVQPGLRFGAGEEGDLFGKAFHAGPVSGSALGEQQRNLLARRDVHLAADAADFAKHSFEPFDIGDGSCIACAGEFRGQRIGARGHRVAADAEFGRDGLPDFLGDERGDRVQGAQDGFQHAQQGAARGGGSGRILAIERGLAEFEEPVAVIVPDKFVQRLRNQVEAIQFHLCFNFGKRDRESGENPMLGRSCRRLFESRIPNPQSRRFAVHQHKTRRVPQLVAEILVTLGALQVEIDGAAIGGQRGEGEAHGIGADCLDAVRIILADALLHFLAHLRNQQRGGGFPDQGFQIDAVDQVQRINRVALGLGHLLAFRIAHDGIDVDLAERHLAGEILGGHDHARDPEEDDVEAGNQHRARDEGLVLTPVGDDLAVLRDGP